MTIGMHHMMLEMPENIEEWDLASSGQSLLKASKK
jgi:hypothetical protein